MLTADNLSVATVAGLIAAGVFVVQFAIPTIFPLLLVGLLKRENSAATWSVVGRTLHSSHWPSILRSDSAGTRGVRGSVRLIGALQIFTLILITIASIVTPLGLYDTVVPAKSLRQETFSYAHDNTSMAIGTLPRRNDLGFSRMCWGIGPPAVCPWSDTIIKETSNETSYTADLPDGYDVRIPKNITEIYSAGLSKLEKTVSSVFDIQWRTYKKVLKSKFQRDNQPYLVGDYRHLSQMILNDAWEAITGLVVDTKSGGIGFRNHTTPPILPFGSSWSEDLLFIEPETECVDLNITLDFNIPYSSDVLEDVVNITVTDHGGFVNLVKDIPSYDRNKTWANASLRDRAYFAAWFSNVYTMFYMNITNPKNKQFSQRFQYINSTMGKAFPVESKATFAFKPRYDQLMTQGEYGEFMNFPSASSNGSISNTAYPNPYSITNSNLSDISVACSDNEDFDFANMSNIAVSCGMVYGAARRRDGSASLFFDPGTEWTVPLYSCASASKASIKTVSFRYNGTAGLKSLEVFDIKPKVYNTEEEKPLWAVENLGLTLNDANPVWGITLPEHANHPNISTARQEHLYLPGMAAKFLTAPTAGSQNLAGVDFYSNIMKTAYNIESMDSNKFFGIPDYTGRSNLVMYRRWQDLSRSPNTAAKIINLIWTEISANAVIGTRSQLPAESLQNLQKRDEPQTTVQVPITVYNRRIRYHFRYGIPAFLVLAFSSLLIAVALLFILIGKATPSKMRRHLDQTSAGRLLTAFLYTNDCPPGASREKWVRQVGRKRVDLDGLYPRALDATTGVALGSPNTDVHTDPPFAYGKMDDAVISMDALPSPQPYSPVGAGGGEAQSYYNSHQGAVLSSNSPYTYVPPGSGMLNPQTGYTEFRSGNNVSPLSSKQQ